MKMVQSKRKITTHFIFHLASYIIAILDNEQNPFSRDQIWCQNEEYSNGHVLLDLSQLSQNNTDPMDDVSTNTYQTQLTQYLKWNSSK